MSNSDSLACQVLFGVSAAAGMPALVPARLIVGNEQVKLVPLDPSSTEKSIVFNFQLWENATGSKDKPEASDESRYFVRLQYREIENGPLITTIVQFRNEKDYVAGPTSHVDSPAALQKAQFLAIARKVKAEKRPPKLEPASSPTAEQANKAASPSAAGQSSTAAVPADSALAGTSRDASGTTPAPSASAAAADSSVTPSIQTPKPAPKLSPEEEQRRLQLEEEQRMHARVLATSQIVKTLHETLVEKAKILNEREFWEFRKKELDDAANRFEHQLAAITYKDIAGAAAQGRASPADPHTSNSNPAATSSSSSGVGGKQEVLTQADRIRILLDYPFVFRAYQNNVPHKMSETAFWNLYVLTQRSLDHDLRVQRSNDIFAIARQELKELQKMGSTFVHHPPDSIRSPESTQASAKANGVEIPATLLAERRRRPQTALLGGTDLMMDIADHPQWGRDVFEDGANGDIPLSRLPPAQRVEAETARAAVDRLNRFGYVALNRVGDLTEAALAAAETPKDAAIVALQAQKVVTESLRAATTPIEQRARAEIEKLAEIPLLEAVPTSSTEAAASSTSKPSGAAAASTNASQAAQDILDVKKLYRKQVQREATVEDLTVPPPTNYQVLKVKPVVQTATEAKRLSIDLLEEDDDVEAEAEDVPHESEPDGGTGHHRAHQRPVVFTSDAANRLATQVMCAMYGTSQPEALPQQLVDTSNATVKRVKLNEIPHVLHLCDEVRDDTVKPPKPSALLINANALPSAQSAYRAARQLSAKMQAQARAAQVTEAQAQVQAQSGQRPDARVSFHSTSLLGDELVQNTTIPQRVRQRLLDLYRIVCELSRHYWATVDEMESNRDAPRKLLRLCQGLDQQSRELRQFRDDLNNSGLSVHAELLIPVQQVLDKVFAHYEKTVQSQTQQMRPPLPAARAAAPTQIQQQHPSAPVRL